MTCKRALLLGTVGGLLIGAAMYAITTSLDPRSPVSLGFEAIHFPLVPLHTWLQRSFASASVDIERIYFIAFPIYWALLGLLIGFVCWTVFRKRKADHAA
jgi:hypothetical protein